MFLVIIELHHAHILGITKDVVLEDTLSNGAPFIDLLTPNPCWLHRHHVYRLHVLLLHGNRVHTLHLFRPILPHGYLIVGRHTMLPQTWIIFHFTLFMHGLMMLWLAMARVFTLPIPVPPLFLPLLTPLIYIISLACLTRKRTLFLSINFEILIMFLLNSYTLFFHVKDLSTRAILLTGKTKDGVCEWPTSSPKLSTSLVVFSSVKTTSSEWNSRLGHPSSHILHHIMSTFSLPYSLSHNSHCNACLSNKSHKLPFLTSIIVSFHPL